MLRTGQLLHPASNPASRPRTGASLPGTMASPRTGLTPAGCPQLVAWLRHHNINLLVVMAPKLLDAPPEHRLGVLAVPVERSPARPQPRNGYWESPAGAETCLMVSRARTVSR